MTRQELINKFFTKIECASCDAGKGKFIVEYYGGKVDRYTCLSCYERELQEGLEGISYDDYKAQIEETIADDGLKCYALGTDEGEFYRLNCDGDHYEVDSITDELLTELEEATNE